MNKSKPLVRTLLVLILSLLILLVVIQFAPSVNVPAVERADLTSRVAAATTAPIPTPVPTTPPSEPTINTPGGALFFSAERAGSWELYAATIEAMADPVRWRQLTQGYSPVRAPALSPDGTQLAFQSRKDGNWEIYTLDIASGLVKRLTDALAYDGAPTWSPDGKQLAFESYRSQNLDIWKVNADGSDPINLTEDESAYDFSPAWSPDGSTIVFTSWSTGKKQLFGISPDGQSLTNLSNNRFHDEQPAWSPDGKQLAFVSNREGCWGEVEATLEVPALQGSVASGNCQRRTIFVSDWDGRTLSKPRQVTFFGRDTAPAWSPDGEWLAFISPRPTRQPLYYVASSGGVPSVFNSAGAWLGSAAWSGLTDLRVGTAPVAEPPLYVDNPIPSNPEEGSKYDFVGMREVYLAPSWGILSSTVSEAYRALRARVLKESGLDFMNTLSDMTRLISSRCDNTCDDLSWHKSGRAFDTLLSFPSSGREAMMLVREDVNAEVYWRVYLRATRQDGTMGEPVKDAPWNLAYSARATIAPGQGGVEANVQPGYYVDFTELARQYGWSRISSHDDADFDWRNNREAIEFWHFQKEDGLTWWEAMKEVYSPAQLTGAFDWNTIVELWEREPSRVYLKGVPPAPSGWKWYTLIPQ